MIVDVTPPPLGRVFVHGELQFENGRDYNFTANIVRHMIDWIEYVHFKLTLS